MLPCSWEGIPDAAMPMLLLRKSRQQVRFQQKIDV